MSEALLERLVEMAETIEKNRPLVEARMAEAGLAGDDLLVLSAAKYWEALEKLASE